MSITPSSIAQHEACDVSIAGKPFVRPVVVGQKRPLIAIFPYMQLSRQDNCTLHACAYRLVVLYVLNKNVMRVLNYSFTSIGAWKVFVTYNFVCI